ncbi:MAG: signal peptidase I [Ignavibacteria bacterium]|nr:signal peptidase I [Ignavibacteria bacterium]
MKLVDWYKKRRDAKKNQKPPEGFGEHMVSWIKTLVWAVSVVTIINGIALASFTVPTGSMESTVLTGDFVFVNKFIYGPSTPQIIPFFNIPLPFLKTPPVIAPTTGDVIVFIFPGNRDQVKPTNFEYYLKRCVARSGQTLLIKNGRVFVDDVEFPLPEHGQFRNLTAEERAYSHANDRVMTFPPGKGWDRDNYGPLRIPMEGDVIQLTPENMIEWATFIRREGHLVSESQMQIDGAPATQYTVKRNYVFGMGDNRDNSLDSRYWGFIPEIDVVGTPMFVYWSMPVSTDSPNGSSIFSRLGAARISRLGTIIR